MIRYLLMSFFIINVVFAQDNIELPDVELILEDQSSLNIATVEEALLRDRNPQFQEVFLEELTATTIGDASINLLQIQQYSRVANLEFVYGSFHSVNIDAFFQNIINNVFYKINYQGMSRDNVSFDNQDLANTSEMKHLFSTHFSTVITNTSLAFDLSYNQKDQNFLNNMSFNPQSHYVPADFTLDHWFSELSYIHVTLGGDFLFSDLQNLEGVSQQEMMIGEAQTAISYRANLAEWNYFEICTQYDFLSYTSDTMAHQGLLKISSDFIMGQGWSSTIGATLLGSTVQPIYGWPELGITYNYRNLVTMSFLISGSSDLLSASNIFMQDQFFETQITPEEYWEYTLSLKTKPTNYFWLGADISYQTYRSKRIYQFDPNLGLYQFDSQQNINLLNFQAIFGFYTSNIIEWIVAYQYQMIPDTWLLESPHTVDVILGLGYKPVGFWVETKISFESPRLLVENTSRESVTLLTMDITQEVHDNIGISLEFDNILNQNIVLSQGRFYGGFQVRGGFDIRF